MENTTFNLRPLNTSDVFKFLRIIKKFGLENVKNCINAIDYKKFIDDNSTQIKKEAVNGMIFTVVTELLSLASERLPECEVEIYNFLASLSNKNAKDIEEQSPVETVKMIKAIVESPDFNDFFMEVSDLFTAKSK